MSRNRTVTYRSLDNGSHLVTRGLKITSSIVWDNPNFSEDESKTLQTYYHEYSTKRSAVNTADLMGHRYVLKLVFESSAHDLTTVRYVGSDGTTYDQAKELRGF